MYKNYLFDLYGTLVDINTNEWKTYLWTKMAELYGFEGAEYTATELKKSYFEQVEAEKELVKIKNPQFSNVDIKIEKVFENLLKIPKGKNELKEIIKYIRENYKNKKALQEEIDFFEETYM